MFSSLISVVALAAGLARGAVVARAPADYVCSDGSIAAVVDSFEYEGKPLTTYSCPAVATENPTPAVRTVQRDTSLTKRNWDLCGASCTTYCYTPAGGGPDPNDCQALANGVSGGSGYTITAGTYLTLTYGSCEVQQSNLISPSQDLYYCPSDLAGVVSYIAWNCQATQNAHGGYCDFYNDFAVSNILVFTS
ncbi:hypothetical protein JAAARDRAFT_41987 [Jaapia argillacea MUCL 33604]|uniref:Uncharacterized protein n=1 Tax=Jaapia argillacea MUCL 33604 TaxID=933084 RepID=A0A067PHN4_9AGAM|nr:hypothetical protein JAAARDRAFT_41987 [Jaapia argillacea MUCL 33604]